ncbi:hypothetical protein [Pyruvatibacter sp.]|uniref:NAD(P)-binding protein n=1 Tax=Pyruvatibacter sp. TaxID=1981328 RepID=UPI003266751D
MTEILETDYLIVGAGAMGMAFVDTLLSETDARILIVDGHAKPGGHWNDAYPFVTLHQPASFYGVASRELSTGEKDQAGLNKGLCDLSSGADINSYFDHVMRHTFLPSGRVQYFPMSHYTGDFNSAHTFHSLTSGKQYEVKVAKKIVNATFLKNSVPSTHTPNFAVEDGVNFMPLNDLPKIDTAPDGYVVIGGGKTGIDACLWLLETGVDPDSICWIKSRDAWLLDRSNTQPTPEFFETTIGTQAGQMEAISGAESLEDMFDRLEACGYFVRLDKSVKPTMFHGATISPLELEALRRIKNIVRMGRVQKVGATEIILDEGTIPTTPGTVHVDCSATAVTNKETTPVFNRNVITPQFVRSYQPLFSASLIAHTEAIYGDDDETKKNQICGVVPLPDSLEDFARFTFAAMMNQYTWSQEPGLDVWLQNNRLDGFSKMIAGISPDDEKRMAVLKRIRKAAVPAVTKLGEFLSEIEKKAAA